MTQDYHRSDAAAGADRRLADFVRGTISDRDLSVDLSGCASGSLLPWPDDQLAGRSVLVATRSQLLAALVMIDLDGMARRIVLAPPGLQPDHVEAVIADAGIDCILTDSAASLPDRRGLTVLQIAEPLTPQSRSRVRRLDTEWVLLTSGTSGRPKMVIHSLHSLTGALPGTLPAGENWSTFYDIRRYGGLQIFFRAILGGAGLTLTDPDEPLEALLHRLGEAAVTSISGTPSHWRRVLMAANRGAFAPPYIRLSGEVADQVVLNGLRAAFPTARIEHAYAATEAGVGFVVADGLEGFPAAFLDAPRSGVDLKIVDGTLRIRSSRTASGYVGAAAPPLLDGEGFVDTTDLVETRASRCFFAGRRNGIINVGGLKVNPEEVEAVLASHPAVHMARASGRKNPVTGAIVVADVVRLASGTGEAALRDDILAHCRDRLERHKVPGAIRFVSHLELSPAGKIRRDATPG